MSIDPLTEKYRDWAPYVFSGNRVIDSRELEGLEPISVAFELEVAPLETIATESAMPEMNIALDDIVVTSGPKPNIGFFERIGNAIGDAWDSITGAGNDTKPENSMEKAVESAKPEGVGEQGNKVTKPEGWETKADRKGDGIKHSDPNNEHNYIRESPAKPNSPQPGQQVDNVKYVKDGVSYDKAGNPLPSAKSQEAHIPATEFDQTVMPPFN